MRNRCRIMRDCSIFHKERVMVMKRILQIVGVCAIGLLLIQLIPFGHSRTNHLSLQSQTGPASRHGPSSRNIVFNVTAMKPIGLGTAISRLVPG